MPRNGDTGFRPITLLSTELKILAKGLAKSLAWVGDGLVGEAQTCAVPGRSIQDDLYLICYILEEINSKSGSGGEVIHLDYEKVFDMVDHRHLGSVFVCVRLGSEFP